MTNEKPYLKLTIIILLMVGMVFFFLGRTSLSALPQSQPLTNLDRLPQVKLPSLIADTSTDMLANSASASARFKIVSVNIIGTFAPVTPEESKLAEIRILGEVENIGDRPGTNPKTLFRIFNKQKKLIASKLGEWTSGYTFHALAPGGKRYVDITLKNPPGDIESLEMSMEPLTIDVLQDAPDSLKISKKRIETKKAQAQGRTIHYYVVSGTLTSISDPMIEHIEVQTFIKNTEGKLFGAAYSSFPQDLLSKNQELSFMQSVIPLKDDDFGEYAVELFGKEVK